MFSKQGLHSYVLGEFRIEICVRTSRFEGLNVYLVWYDIWARDEVARDLDRVCVVGFVFFLILRTCFDDQTKSIT